MLSEFLSSRTRKLTFFLFSTSLQYESGKAVCSKRAQRDIQLAFTGEKNSLLEAMYCPSSHCTINVETYAPSLQEVTIGGSPGALPAMVEQVYNGTAGEPKINTESKTGSTSALKHPSEDLRAEFAAKLKIQFANADHAGKDGSLCSICS